MAAIITAETSTYSNGDNTLEMEYPHVELGNPEATSRANDMIEMNVHRAGQVFTNPKEGEAYDGGREYYSITYNGDDYISFVTTSILEHKGAVHPMYTFHGYIINAQTGYGVTFEELCNNSEQYADVSDLAQKGIYRYSDGSPYTGNLIADINRRQQNCYINEDGILCLLFSPYSIAPWSAGALYIPVCSIFNRAG